MHEEAVFSSSEDRIRAGQATNAVAGPSIVRQGAPPGTAGVWLRHAAEGLVSVLFPSDCRTCGLPVLNPSCLPVCPQCFAGMHHIHSHGRVCSICGERHWQIGLASHQRRENRRGAFARAPQVTGRAVVIVDDVYTPGTTVTEWACVPLEAGAARVGVATVARTLKNASNNGSLNVSEFPGSKKQAEPEETLEVKDLRNFETLTL